MLRTLRARFLLAKNELIFLLVVPAIVIERIFKKLNSFFVLLYVLFLIVEFRKIQSEKGRKNKKTIVRSEALLVTRPLSKIDYLGSSLIITGVMTLLFTLTTLGVLLYILQERGADGLIRFLNQYPANYNGIWIETPPNVSISYAHSLIKLRVLVVTGLSFLITSTLAFRCQRYHFSRFQDMAVMLMYITFVCLISLILMNFNLEIEKNLFYIAVGIGCLNIYRGYRNFRKVDCI